MAKRSPKENADAGVDPVTLALAGVLGISAWCAWRVIVAARAVIAAAEDKETYVEGWRGVREARRLLVEYSGLSDEDCGTCEP